MWISSQTMTNCFCHQEGIGVVEKKLVLPA